MTEHSQEWISLREHFEALLASRDEAVMRAEATMNKRLDGMNEFRETLRDQASRFVTMDALTARLDTLQVRLTSLEKSRDTLDGKILSWGVVFLVLNLLIAGVALWLRR